MTDAIYFSPKTYSDSPDLLQWDLLMKPCQHREHNPPGMMVYKPGRYEHECPGCGLITQFNVPKVTYR